MHHHTVFSVRAAWPGFLSPLLGPLLGLLMLVLWPQGSMAGNLHIDLLAPEIAREMTPGAVEPDGIRDGQILIRSIELRAQKVSFPELGITRQKIRELLVKRYLQLGPTLSVGAMHRLADDLTGLYRDQGLHFATVVVTPQEIVDGHLVLRLRVGTLSEVQVHGNQLYTSTQLLAPFREQMAGPVYGPDVERGLNRLNRLAGLRVFGIFSVGRSDGETRLNLRVQQERHQDTEVRMDNHGLVDTGENRLLLRHSRNNLFRQGGTLTATALITNESGNLLGGLGWQRPVAHQQRISLSLMRSEFAIGGEFAVLGLRGTLDMASIGWGLDSLAPHLPGASFQLTLAAKQAEVKSDLFARDLAQKFRYVTLTPALNYRWHQPDLRLTHLASANPLLGVIRQSENTDPESPFTALRGEYNLRHELTLGGGQFPTQLQLRGVYSPEGLPSSERWSLTGPDAVRGFSPALFSSDRAWLASLEQTLYAWQWANDWRTRPYLFIDQAQGWLADSSGSEARFLGAGVGLDLSFRDTIRAGLHWGRALDQDNSDNLAIEEGNDAVYGHLSVRFR